MEEKFFYKMIRNCFLQYGRNIDSIPLSNEEYEDLYKKIQSRKQLEPEGNLYEFIEDIVYDFLTDEGSPW